MSAVGIHRLRTWISRTSMIVLVACLGFLGLDHWHWSSTYAEQRTALAEAEQAAREDASATERLQELIDAQTNASLRQTDRARNLGLLALLAAGSWVLTQRKPGPKQPPLPLTVAKCIPRPGPALPSTDSIPRPSPKVTPPDVDLTPLPEIVQRSGSRPDRLIPLLHAVQQHYGYLPEPVLIEIGSRTEISPATLAGVATFYQRFRTKPRGKHLLQVCRGTACHVAGADRVLAELKSRLGIPLELDTDPAGRATVETVGCLGCCELAPLVQRDDELMTHVRVEDLPDLVAACQDRPAKRKSGYRPFRRSAPVVAATSATATLLTGANGKARTSSIITHDWPSTGFRTLEDYEQLGGFAALALCLSQYTAESILDELEKSGLRGRGGGGFPTVRKWRMVHGQTGNKYVVANGDEGDPGAFMDRSIMESAPASVLEGMTIAARAVGASRGYVYVRNEYPTAVLTIRETVEQMRAKGYLGKHILGSDFTFDVEVVEGAGAFVCGEETALIQSLMGQRGTPHYRPPFPAEAGLWGCPTLVNNVETLTCVPWILRHGGETFASMGTTSSKGTKVFSLAGKVRRGGLVEAPMGISIRELVEEYGGGVAEGRRFKAIQIGGPSGGCLPAEMADIPIDYDVLKERGAIMGSGGLVVLDDTDCMVDVARYFLEFTEQESCGHCTFCRVGTRKLLDLLERLCAGKAKRRDLVEIESLAESVVQGSLCGLGKTAPNPVLTTLKYFREEYEAHLQGNCPAGRCKALIDYRINRDCVGCTLCAQHCPVAAIPPTPYRQHVIDDGLCTRCDACRTTCPEDAIEIFSPSLHKRSESPIQVA